MPEGERFAALLESLADGSPVDWAAVEATATGDDELAELRQLRRLEWAVAHQRRALTRGATWSHLELIEKIGAGAFGEVYRAHDPRLARDVALKLLYEPMAAHDARASAAIEEGRLLARVRHPNVVTVYGAECRDGQVGIWTEFIDGQTLQTIVTDHGPLSSDEVASIGLDLCRALSAVHEAGLLHRDIKAQNVMREAGGRIVLMDFGTGRDLDPLPGQKTNVSGTPLYLAPELFAGGEASAASDIYALGVLMFFLLTGRYPVAGRTLGEVRDGHVIGPTASVRDARAGVSAALGDAIDRAISREPARRFASAREFERAIAGAQPARPRRAYLGRAAASAVIIVAGASWWSLAHQTARPAEQSASAIVPSVSNDRGDQLASMAGQASQVLVPTVSPTVVQPSSPKVVPLPPVPTDQGIGTIPLDDFAPENASISPDGRFVADRYPASGDLRLRNLATMQPTRLVVRSAPGSSYAYKPAFSRDGKRLAFVWHVGSKWQLGIMNVGSSAGPEPLLFDVDSDPDIRVDFVHDWSMDGRSVLVTLTGPGTKQRLGWASASGDYAFVSVREFGASDSMWPSVRLSPDGTRIAYSIGKLGLGVPARWIHLVTPDGSRDEPVVTTKALNQNPFWTPDGRLIYTSDLDGTTDLYGIQTREGIPDPPQKLIPNIGEGNVIGVGPDLTLFYRSYNPGLEKIFVAPIADDPDARAATFRPTSDFAGFLPKWSPDGESVAFLRHRTLPSGPLDLLVRLLTGKDGKERRLREDTTNLPPMWLDSKGVFGRLHDRTWEHKFLEATRFDVTSGDPVPIGAALEAGIRPTPAGVVSLDGTTVYAGAAEGGGPWDRIVAIDIATGRVVRVVCRLPEDLAHEHDFRRFGMALSPDGLELVVAIRTSESARIFRIGVAGTDLRNLYEPYTTAATYNKVAWTTRGIFFSQAVGTDRQGGVTSWRLMRIDPDGGAPQPQIEVNGTDADANFDITPDGTRIALHPSVFARQPFDSELGGRNELRALKLKPPDQIKKE